MTKVMLAHAIVIALLGVGLIVGAFLDSSLTLWWERGIVVGCGLLALIVANGLMEIREMTLYLSGKREEARGDQ